MRSDNGFEPIAFQDGDDVPRYLEKLLIKAQTLLSDTHS